MFMSTRREFLTRMAAAGATAKAFDSDAAAADNAGVPLKPVATRDRAAGPNIKSVIRRDETLLRLGGFGDNYPVTWAADDRQFVSVTDGYGWFQNPTKRYAGRLWAISGNPQHASFEDVPGYPDLVQGREPINYCRYLAYGTLAVDGCIYQFLHTPNYPPNVWLDAHMIGAKLIYSPDNGRTWHNQDGSTPVIWEPWYERSRRNMAFFQEPQDAFSFLTFLQMGRNYQANRDGYVYIYSPNGNYDGSMNQLVMLRVPRQSILNREAYEYFAGRRPDGSATWVKDIQRRAVVHTFLRGLVNRASHIGDDFPYAWMPSVVYNAPLGLYMMVNWGMNCSSEGIYFAKPSYLGIWTAAHPWGPWTQIHEELAWTPGNDPEACAYSPQIAPKWIAEDGKSFWLVWTDVKGWRDPHLIELFRNSPETPQEIRDNMLQTRQILPYYALSTQRFDLITG
jgi:hypothetical protein